MSVRPYVLIVDDDADIREGLGEILRTEGFDVEEAANGREALSCMMHDGAPAVVLLDLMMPVMSGWQFRAAQLDDARVASVPVIVVSAGDRAADEAHRLGARDFIAKPIDLARLISLVAHCVDEAAAGVPEHA